MAADPLDRIAEICHAQPPDALTQIAAVLGFEEQSPGFTDTARAALMWVLWHNQGGSSPTGQAVRFALGMGQFDRLTADQVAQAKTWAPGIPGLAHTDATGVPASHTHDCKQYADSKGKCMACGRAVAADGVTEALATRQWPRDLTEAEMDALATALNEHDAGSIGFHALVDRVLAVAQGTAGVSLGQDQTVPPSTTDGAPK